MQRKGAQISIPKLDPKHLIWVVVVTGFTVRCSRFRVLYAHRSIVLDSHVGGVATKAT